MPATLLPIFLRLEQRPVLVVGAGTVALSKIGYLLDAGAQITIVAPAGSEEVYDLAARGRLVWRRHRFERDDLEGMFLVVAATNDSEVNRAIHQEALRRNLLCNAVDDPPNCDFYFGSVVRRGDLQISISTAGRSPALAQRLRREIDGQLPDEVGTWLAEIGSMRDEIRAGVPASPGRTAILHELAGRPLCSSPSCPTREWARQQIATLRDEVLR